MREKNRINSTLKILTLSATLLGFAITPGAILAQTPSHGIAMYGQPALPADYKHLPQVNPDAPKGGQIVFGEAGSFDSMNPYILKGRAPAAMGSLVVQTLMGRNYDEPFALYGVLAESITVDDTRSWVEFTLRPEARFSDGSPVTAEDVMWSYETLGTKGNPRYHTAWQKVAKMEQTGPRSIRFTFNTEDRELPLLLGMRPVLQKAQWEGKEFDESSLMVPIGSGPYIVDSFEAGRYIVFKRNPDWWAADLPFYKGQHNLDEIRYEYFGDGGVLFEAFKGGLITSYRESNAEKWLTAYDWPEVKTGTIVKSEVPHERPSGIYGFVMNTRDPMFADWRVREALIQALNFEFINQTLNAGIKPRIESYFGNSVLGYTPGTAAEGRVLDLLKPYSDQLLSGTIEGYTLPKGDATQADDRANLRSATKLLEEAGWTVQNGTLTYKDGTPFKFDILITNGANDMIATANIYIESLKRLGIEAQIQTVDSAQYKERTNNYAFDMTTYWVSLSLSPGNEQFLYWGAQGVTEPGRRNLMGMNSPPAEAMIRTMLETTDQQEFVAATQALDRILTAGRYVVPLWFDKVSRIAHRKELQYPAKNLPIYGDWLGFQPELWWYQP